ncbi:hypothetical protein HOLleu_07999 [Holothuria leucospilota]|uniref:Uncharacterized protein n=1 Tax=Holothuria leucospilota TaxID=206669 RepID=A0A9Q1CHK3_HOLLE|nr:hypothetical protein HOLleu_07999 [Holothuria leucospilota]
MSYVTATDALIMDTDLYFILARSNNGTYDGWVQSFLYKWNVKKSQFELHQLLKTHAPVSVAATVMENKYYLIFAEKSNMTQIWKYDTRQLQFKRHHFGTWWLCCY